MGKSRRKRAARAAARPTPGQRASLAVRTRAFIMGALPVLAIFLGTRQLLAEAFRIPSGSMEPTLLVGDWLFVNKLRFGPHIPFTSHSLPGYASPKAWRRHRLHLAAAGCDDSDISRPGHADVGEAHRRSRRRHAPHASRAADRQWRRRPYRPTRLSSRMPSPTSRRQSSRGSIKSRSAALDSARQYQRPASTSGGRSSCPPARSS